MLLVALLLRSARDQVPGESESKTTAVRLGWFFSWNCWAQERLANHCDHT